MELQGRIVRVLGETSGTNQQGNPWRKLEYLFGFYENPSDLYERTIVLSFMNDRIETNKGYNVGDVVKVRVAMTCRENPQGSGRYFNDIRNGDLMMVQKATPATGGQQPAPQPASQPAPAPQQQPQQQEGGKADDLPF